MPDFPLLDHAGNRPDGKRSFFPALMCKILPFFLLSDFVPPIVELAAPVFLWA